MSAPGQPPPAPLPFPTSLCHGCLALELAPGRNSVFLRCTALPGKYPPQPVRQCAAFRPRRPPGKGDERSSADP